MNLGVAKISITYVIIAVLWITLSDKVLLFIGAALSIKQILFWSSIKSYCFVLFTGYMLHKLIKKQNKTLEKSELQYRDCFENNPSPMFIFNKATFAFLQVNDAATALYGYTKDEFNELTVFDIRPSGQLLDIITEIHSPPDKDSAIWKHKKKDGTIIFVHTTSHAIVSAQTENVIVMVKNITESIVADELLQKANTDLQIANDELTAYKNLLSKIQNIAKLGGWEYHLQTAKLKQTDGMFAIFDFASQHDKDPVGTLIAHIHPEDKEEFLVNKARIDTSDATLMSNFRIINDYGDIKYVQQIAQTELRDGKPFKIYGAVQDITDLRRIENERNEYLLKLEDTLNSISDAFFTLDRDWNICSANAMFETICGINRHEAIGKKFFDLWPVGCDSPFYKNYNKTLTDKVTVKFEEYSVTLNKWLRMICYPTKEGAAIYFADITESKEKDIRLKNALERYDMVSEATQDMVYEFDLANNKLIYSQRYGYFAKARLVDENDPSSSWMSMIHPLDLQKVINANTNAIVNKNIKYQCEYRVDVGDGQYRYVYDQAKIIFDENNLPVRMIGAIKDIHDLKQTSEENRRLGEIINTVNNMVLITDEQNYVVWANSAFTKFTGSVLSEIIGMAPVNVIGCKKPDLKLLNKIVQQKQNREIFSAEIAITNENGKQSWVHIDFTPLSNNQNEPDGYIAVYIDITAMKEKEQSMLKQNNILRQIAWIESHEVRRTLASILALVDLIRCSEDERESHELLDMIDTSAKDLDYMVRKINSHITDVTF